VGIGKTVTGTDRSLSGADKGNYSLNNTTATTTADITAKAITATGILGVDKTYNNTLVAGLNTADGAVTGGAITDADNLFYTADAITLNSSGAAGAFATKDVGVSKAVTVSGLALGNNGAGNYTVTDASSATADITSLFQPVPVLVPTETQPVQPTAMLSGDTLYGGLAGLNLTVTGAGVGMPPIQLAETPPVQPAQVIVPAETPPVQPDQAIVQDKTQSVELDPVIAPVETPLVQPAQVRVLAETQPVQPAQVRVPTEMPSVGPDPVLIPAETKPNIYVPPQRPRKNDRY